MPNRKSKGKKACEHKVRYPCKEAAEHFGKPVNLRTYHCPHSGQWHNTSEGALGFGPKAVKKIA